MNINKNDKEKKSLAPIATRILHWGALPIIASLLRLLWEILQREPYSAATAAYFGAALERPLSALMLLSAMALIADRAEREIHSGK